jgi:hypothetical protein
MTKEEFEKYMADELDALEKEPTLARYEALKKSRAAYLEVKDDEDAKVPVEVIEIEKVDVSATVATLARKLEQLAGEVASIKAAMSAKKNDTEDRMEAIAEKLEDKPADDAEKTEEVAEKAEDEPAEEVTDEPVEKEEGDSSDNDEADAPSEDEPLEKSDESDGGWEQDMSPRMSDDEIAQMVKGEQLYPVK